MNSHGTKLGKGVKKVHVNEMEVKHRESFVKNCGLLSEIDYYHFQKVYSFS